jgi:FKBP-type peptidyl-prolyl cis-trans isomerase
MTTLAIFLVTAYLVLPTATCFSVKALPTNTDTVLRRPRHSLLALQSLRPPNVEDPIVFSRRGAWLSLLTMLATSAPAYAVVAPTSKQNKCTDIETCREIGDQKVKQDLQESPVTLLPSGTRYKVLRAGIGSNVVVQEGSSIDLIYTLSRAGGRYMYSQGMGFELVDGGNGNMVKDVGGLDSLKVIVGSHQQVPVGIEQSLLGMKRGERRRVELTPNVGFATSNWEPAPRTAGGKQAIRAYQRILEGFGSQPPFPAPTIWDIEVLRIRN